MSSGSDSDLVQAVTELQFGNYISLAIAAAVTYDYILTFSKEISYIWNRSWTFISATFLVVRYLGLFIAVWKHFYTRTHASTVLLFATDYAFVIFLAAADIVMILRVYAMYNQSKLVLGSLLVLYVATIVLYSISVVYYDNLSTNLTMTTPQVLDMSFCLPTYSRTTAFGKYKAVPRLTLAGLLVLLAIVRFGKDAFQAYMVSHRWETNRYLNLLVREGIFYFLAHLLNNIEFGQNMAGIIVNAFNFSVLFVLSPRFIINVRQLYLHDLLRVSGECNGIDSGFGLSGRESSHATAASSVEFTHSFGVSDGDVEMGVLGRDADASGY